MALDCATESVEHVGARRHIAPAGTERGVAAPSCPCKVCGSPAFLFDVVDFNKVCAEPDCYLYGLSGEPVYYYKCGTCRFLFTVACDGWPEQEFRERIYNADYRLIDGDYLTKRPHQQAALIAEKFGEHPSLRILDFGSGSGAMAAGLRERGFTGVASFDPYSQPERPDGTFDLITCLEVIHHAPHPDRFMAELKSFTHPGSCIVLATALVPPDIDHVRGKWIYVAPRNGHVSIYSEEALQHLAANHGFFVCQGDGLIGLVPQDGSQLGKLIMANIALPSQAVTVGAPSRTNEAGWRRVVVRSQWHDMETAGDHGFRWTRASRIEWNIDRMRAYPCAVRVRVPLMMEIGADFANACFLVLDGERKPVTRVPGGIAATFAPEEADGHFLVLETPPPLSPAEAGTASGDTRKLGLAVFVVE